ncbi:MAG: aldo/keto reductase [Oscillochloridaceae bacterium umkhey_bin13]
MRYRQLGQTSLRVSELGLGCARIAGVFAERSRGGPRYLLDQVLDHGINFFDTADMYAQGESEHLLGQVFAKRRSQVIIATKAGYILPPQRKFVARIKPLLRPLVRALGLRRQQVSGTIRGEIQQQDFRPEYLIAAVEASLKRLRTDYIDLFQLHSPSAEVIRNGAFIEPLERLKAQGKIRYYGIAADSVDDGLVTLQHDQISTVMTPFGLLDREALDHLLPQAQTQGIGILARGCFGGGLLKPMPIEELRNLTPKWPQIAAFQELADQAGRPLIEIALQFVQASAGVSVNVLGMRTVEHLTTNLRYYEAPPLDPELYAKLLAVPRDGAT